VPFKEASMRVLIIDDSTATRAILKGIMKEIGFEVFEAGHGCEALERLKTIGKPDLALVDWNMPEMNGYDFICSVRADHAYDDLLLMMVTSETEISKMTKALEAGANEYIMKPFSKDALLEKLSMMGIEVS